ncbi:MAG: YitT family protein, partial [Mucinivorans sp.]
MKSKEIKSYALVLCGAFLIAAAFVLFITPYKIVPGGVYGAGVVFNYLFPSIQVGTWGLMMDIPLLTISLFLFGKFFGAKTIFAAVSCPVMMDAMTSFIGSDPATMLGGSINLT